MPVDITGFITLLAMLGAHLVTTVWWAASITRRVDHIEKWIASNAHTAERLVALEQQIAALGAGIARIEHHLRHTVK